MPSPPPPQLDREVANAIVEMEALQRRAIDGDVMAQLVIARLDQARVEFQRRYAELHFENGFTAPLDGYLDRPE